MSHYVVKLVNPRQHDKTLSSISFEEEKVNFNSTFPHYRVRFYNIQGSFAFKTNSVVLYAVLFIYMW